MIRQCFTAILLFVLSALANGQSCDFGKSLSCCSTHVNYIVKSYKTNSLSITINPRTRARDVCCHMKHVERCLLMESDCRSLYKDFVLNLYGSLTADHIDCMIYASIPCQGIDPVRHNEITLLFYSPPVETRIVVLQDGRKAPQILPPTTIYADTVTEPGLIMDTMEPEEGQPLNFGEETVAECVDEAEEIPSTTAPEVNANKRPTKCSKTRVVVTPASSIQEEPDTVGISSIKDDKDKGKTSGCKKVSKTPDETPTENVISPTSTPEDSDEDTNGGCQENNEPAQTQGESTVETPTENTSGEETTNEPGVGEDNPAETPSGEENPAQAAASGEVAPTQIASAEENSVLTAPDGESPAQTTSGEEIPAQTTSGDETPAQTTSGEETPAQTTSGEEAPAQTTSGEEVPAETISGEETPAQTTSDEGAPAETTSGEENPVKTSSNEENPSESNSGEENSNVVEKPQTSGCKKPSKVRNQSGEQSPSTDGSNQGQEGSSEQPCAPEDAKSDLAHQSGADSEEDTQVPDHGPGCKTVAAHDPSDCPSAPRRISPDEMKGACCLGRFLEPCANSVSKCHHLYGALHSFLSHFDCLTLDIQHSCFEKEVTVEVANNEDSSEEEQRVAPPRRRRPQHQAPKRGNSNRKIKKQESSEENERDDE